MNVKLMRKRITAPGRKAYQCPEDMIELINEYFEDSAGTLLIDEETGTPVLDKYGNEIIIGGYTPGLAGLAFCLGMTTNGLRDYRNDDEYKPLLDMAKQYIEAIVETKLYSRDSARGAEFALNAMHGWQLKKDTGNAEGMVQIIDLPSAGVIEQDDDDSPTIEDLRSAAAKLIEDKNVN